MVGQRIGYSRVSTLDQLFADRASGKESKDVERPQLESLLGFVREGDLVVDSMDRLARNLDDLRRLVQSLVKRGVCIEFV